MTYEEALAILRKKTRVIQRMAEDTGLTARTLHLIIDGTTKNPSYSTTQKITKWVEEN